MCWYPYNVRIRREAGKVIRMCIQRRLISSQERQPGAALPATDAEPGSTGLVDDGSRTEQWILLAKWGVDRVRRFRTFMTGFASVPSSRDLILRWAEVMVAARANGRRIEAADAWIAATTLLYNATLITHNPKDYLGVPNLRVLSCL